MRRGVLYLAHPVSAPTADGIADNLARARRWLRWFVDHTDHAVCAPWFAYVLELDEAKYRDRGLRDDLLMLDGCDAIVLVGGRLSDGMRLEMDHAHRRGLAVCSLITFGAEPPDAARTPEALRALREELG